MFIHKLIVYCYIDTWVTYQNMNALIYLYFNIMACIFMYVSICKGILVFVFMNISISV